MRGNFGAIIQANVVGNIYDAERDKKIKEGRWEELNGITADAK